MPRLEFGMPLPLSPAERGAITKWRNRQGSSGSGQPSFFDLVPMGVEDKPRNTKTEERHYLIGAWRVTDLACYDCGSLLIEYGRITNLKARRKIPLEVIRKCPRCPGALTVFRPRVAQSQLIFPE